MKTIRNLLLVAVALLNNACPQSAFAATDAECFYQTPFGPAWICTDRPMPKPVSAPVPAPQPVFIPAFEQGVTIKSPWGTWPVNADYFATSDTAFVLCKRLQCSFVFEQACSMGGGPFVCTKPERMLVINGIPFNAGVLAAFYARNPEKDFPGLADKLVAAEIAKRK